MSFASWGKFLDSFPTHQEAIKFIVKCNIALARMDSITDEERDSITFAIHPTYDNIRGRNWLFGVYMKNAPIR